MKPKKSTLGPWNQGLYEISSTAREIVGTMREDHAGRVYRYARAGATALAPAKNTTAAALNADWVNESVTAQVLVGGTQVSITHGAVDADVLDEDHFRGGQLHINDADGEAHWYPIVYSTAVTATSTTLTLTLDDPVQVALTTSSEATPVPSPYMGTVISATETDEATGVPLVTVTADYYYWSQTRGEGLYWANTDEAAVGTELILSATDGELSPNILAYATTSSVDVTQAPVAVAVGTAGVDGEYKPCKYVID